MSGSVLMSGLATQRGQGVFAAGEQERGFGARPLFHETAAQVLDGALRAGDGASGVAERGEFRIAAVAAPPSPLKPCDPLPMTVAMVPVLDTWRMRWFRRSAM